ncbi:MAG: NADH-quinone oxidoreductase subunit NuoK [Bacteroidetes bacterium]|nr:NADH-quinone oxidoreductase subunit NuoK [Bacteroidota bacterium]
MNPQEHLYYYLAVSAALFMLGMVGVLIRRNAIIVFLCIELMLNAVNLSLVAFSSYLNDPTGTMLVFFVMCVAAAEAVVGLAIIIAMFRNRESVNISDINIFKW